MTDFDFISLILGLGSIAVGTAGPAIKFVKNEIAEKKQVSQQPQIQSPVQQAPIQATTTQTAQVAANVEPQIVYTTKPVVEKKKMEATSPISFVGNISIPVPADN